MATDHIRYDLLAQDALRGLVRKVLTDTAKSGLPGEHHFSISFRTDAEGVKLSPRLREQFPQEMTVILQYQFWDLKVTDQAFEVGLSFGGVPEKLSVPFAAIKSLQQAPPPTSRSRHRKPLPRKQRRRPRPPRTGLWAKWCGSTASGRNNSSIYSNRFGLFGALAGARHRLHCGHDKNPYRD